MYLTNPYDSNDYDVSKPIHMIVMTDDVSMYYVSKPIHMIVMTDDVSEVDLLPIHMIVMTDDVSKDDVSNPYDSNDG